MSRNGIWKVLPALLLAAACSSVERAEREAERTSVSIARWLPENPVHRETEVFQVLKEESRPHLGLAPVPEPKSALPDELDEVFGLPRGRYTHEDIARNFEENTGIPVVLGEAYVPGAAASAAAVEEGQVSAPSAADAGPADGTGGEIVKFLAAPVEDTGQELLNWSGTVSRFLNEWTEEAGFDWEWDAAGNRVVVERSVSRSWIVNALAGQQEWGISVSSAATASAEGVTGGNNQSIQSTFEDDPWREVRAQLRFAARGECDLDMSESTGRVSVTGLPNAVRRVERQLQELNRTTLLPVEVSFSMFRVEHRKQQSFDLGVAAVLRHIFGSPLAVGIGGTNGIVIRRPSNLRGPNTYSATVQALRDIGTVTRLLAVDIPSLNGRPAQFYDLFDRVYLSEYKVTTTEHGVSTELTPGTVSEGIMISYRSQIVAHDELLVRIAINILDKAQIETFSPDAVQATTLQQPNQGRRAIKSSQSIRTGETLVLTGFADRFVQGANKIGVGAEGISGLQDGGERQRVEQVMLVTASIGRPLGIVEESAGIRPVAELRSGAGDRKSAPLHGRQGRPGRELSAVDRSPRRPAARRRPWTRPRLRRRLCGDARCERRLPQVAGRRSAAG